MIDATVPTKAFCLSSQSIFFPMRPLKSELTAVNDSFLVKIGNGTADGVNKVSCIVFVVVSLSADPVKQLSTLGQLGNKVHYDSCFYVIKRDAQTQRREKKKSENGLE